MLNWINLSSEEQLQLAINKSKDESIDGIVLFKHSTTCSISAMAKNRLERKWDFDEQKLPVYYLDLLSYRNISNLIISELHIQHQSPQLLLLKNGVCVYHSSHSEISVDELHEAIDEIS
jgi:bacillithiol system protein YtxJ